MNLLFGQSNNKDGEKDRESKDKYNVLAKSESGAESSREIAEYAAPNLEPLYKNDGNDKDQQTFCDITMQLLSLPWYIAFKFTVPDCQKVYCLLCQLTKIKFFRKDGRIGIF